jgi:hypothetical protein
MKATWLWTIVAVWVGGGWVQGAVVFQDHFLGSSLDGTKWTSTGSVTVGPVTAATNRPASPSSVTVNPQAGIRSIATFDSNAEEFTIKLTGWNAIHENSFSVGFSDVSGSNSITFSTKSTSPTAMNVSMRSGGGPVQTKSIAMNSVFFQGNWTLTFSDERVTFNNDTASWMTPFDTNIIAPTTNGPAWAIPTAAMSFFMQSGGLGSNADLDAISIAVPEPASFGLIGVAGTLLLARRRRV